MSRLDKDLYLKDLQQKLGDFLPANEMPRILRAADEALADYEVASAPAGGGAESDSEDLLRYFLDAKTVEEKSPKTIKRYRYVLTRLLKDTKIPYAKMTVYHLRDYLNSERARGVSPSTLEGNRQIYSSFFGWLLREGLIQKNPMNNLAVIKKPKVQRKPLSPVDLEKLEQVAWNTGSDRNVAIITFLESTGCRVSEMCALNRDDIDLGAQSARVLGKGSKERTVWFDDVAAWYLEEYLNRRTDDDPALFLSRKGGHLSTDGVRVMLNKIAKAAGITKVHPHRFRRTRATSLIDAGMAIQDVAAILGHDKLDTTMRYVYIDSRNVANNYKKYA